MIHRPHTTKLLTLTAALIAPSLTHAAEKKEPALFNEWLHAQYPATTPWDFGAELRGRYEDKDDAGVTPNTDFISGTADSREAIYFREKIHAGYKADWFSAFIEARDSSGHEDLKADDTFDLYQAYLKIGNPKEFPITAQIGRQEMIYGDQRFIGNGDWSNVGRSFDAIKLRYESNCFWVDAFTSKVVLNDDDNFNVSNDYDYFSGVYAGSSELIPWQETHVYFLARNYAVDAPNALGLGVPGSPSTQRDVYTIGTYWKAKPDALHGWDYGAEFAWQFGSIYNVAQDKRLDLQGAGVFLDAGYTFKDVCWTPRVGVGYDYGSGDDDGTDGKVQTFENQFGTQHKVYGLMDINGVRNLHIPRISITAKPVKGLTFGVNYLTFFLANDNDLYYPESGPGRTLNGYGANTGHGSYVGSELDLYATYVPTKWANIQVGYGHFFTGDYIDDSVSSVPGASSTDADWVYTQLMLTF